MVNAVTAVLFKMGVFRDDCDDVGVPPGAAIRGWVPGSIGAVVVAAGGLTRA
jgi:hypothetical protein